MHREMMSCLCLVRSCPCSSHSSSICPQPIAKFPVLFLLVPPFQIAISVGKEPSSHFFSYRNHFENSLPLAQDLQKILSRPPIHRYWKLWIQGNPICIDKYFATLPCIHYFSPPPHYQAAMFLAFTSARTWM